LKVALRFARLTRGPTRPGAAPAAGVSVTLRKRFANLFAPSDLGFRAMA